jgi:hypothetical protein
LWNESRAANRLVAKSRLAASPKNSPSRSSPVAKKTTVGSGALPSGVVKPASISASGLVITEGPAATPSSQLESA